MRRMSTPERWVFAAIILLVGIPALIALVYLSTRAAIKDPETQKPYQRVAWAKHVFTVTIQQIDMKRKRGEMSDAEYADTKQLRKDVMAAIDRADSALRLNDAGTVDAELQAASKLHRDLLKRTNISEEAIPPFQPKDR
jgi:hypothetical protein